MERDSQNKIHVSRELIEEIRSFPLKRSIEHCGTTFYVSPFDFYATCPQCLIRMKVRSFSATTEIEDVFDAVFQWMNRPEAMVIVNERQKEISFDSQESDD